MALTSNEKRVLSAVLAAEEALAGQRAPELGDIIEATPELGRVNRQEAIDSLRATDLLIKSLRFVAGGQDAEVYYSPDHKQALAELAHDPEAERLADVRVEPKRRERLSDLAGPA